MLNIDIWNIAFTVINILVLYFFLKHLLFRPVQKIMDERKQMVEQDLDAAQNAKGEAIRMKEEYEASIANADEEASRIVEDAKRKASAEYDQMLIQARTDAEKKRQEADQEIALERERAVSELRNSVADLALVAAEKLMEQHSGEESDKRLYDAFLEDAEDHHD